MASAAWYAGKAEHYAETAARHLTEDPRDMRIAEVAAGIAQAYATLAAAGDLKHAGVRHAIPKREVDGVDYSDLAADGPSTSVDEAWKNVANYVRQRDRAMSAYVVHPDLNIEVADEITPTHLLRWSSLEILLAERKKQVDAEWTAFIGGAS